MFGVSGGGEGAGKEAQRGGGGPAPRGTQVTGSTLEAIGRLW